jgi:glycine/D-amino acid oxidase-like deaminating enzyme
MAVDTPARIIVVGAGPVGLEASLYARFLGYEVTILERGEIADNVRKWGQEPMSTPFRDNCSSLGLAALAAQDPHFQPPSPDAYLTRDEWADRYLYPLSQTDLLADSLRVRTEALTIGRCDYDQAAPDAAERRAESMLRVVSWDELGRETEDTAEVVMDASGLSPNRVVYRDLLVPNDSGTEYAAEELRSSQSTESHADVQDLDRYLVLPEPNFYVIGAKSFGGQRACTHLLARQQIRRLFAIIGDRADLDLYAGARRLLE